MFGVESFNCDDIALHRRVGSASCFRMVPFEPAAWLGFREYCAKTRRSRPQNRERGRSQVKVGPEVDFACFGIIDQLIGGAFIKDLAFMDQVSAIHQFQSLADIMIGNQDA